MELIGILLDKLPWFKNQNNDTLIRHFRWASIAEGITCILLYLIAMPIKYQWGIWQQMIPIGTLHGIMFTWYLILLYYVIKPLKWDAEESVFALIAAFFPFGTFWVDWKLIPEKYRTPLFK